MNGGRNAQGSRKIAAIVPSFEEDKSLLRHVTTLVEDQDFAEVILVDASVGVGREIALSVAAHFQANPAVTVLLDAPAGRARQMNHGARSATGEILIFVHADTILPADCATTIHKSVDGDSVWGRFDVRLDADGIALRVVEFMMNQRSRWTVGGFPDQVLMEDIEMSKQLKKFSSPSIPRANVVTSARRWQVNGVFRTIGLMWKLRLMYFFGASPETLASMYGNARMTPHNERRKPT